MHCLRGLLQCAHLVLCCIQSLDVTMRDSRIVSWNDYGLFGNSWVEDIRMVAVCLQSLTPRLEDETGGLGGCEQILPHCIKSAVIRRDHKLRGMGRRHHMLASIERLSGSPECNLNTTVCLIVYCGLVANNANWIVYNWFLQRCSSSVAQIPRWDRIAAKVGKVYRLASRKECNGMAAGPGYIEQGIGICKGCTGFKLEEYNTRRVRGVRIPGTGDRVPGRRCSAHAEKDQRSMNGKPSLSIKSYGRLIGGVAHKHIAGCRRSTYVGYDGVQETSQQFGMHGRIISADRAVGFTSKNISPILEANLSFRFDGTWSEATRTRQISSDKCARYLAREWKQPAVRTNLKPQIGHGKGRTWTWARHRMAHDPSVTTKIKNMAGHYPRATRARLEHECNGPGGRTNPFDGTWSGATGPAGRTKPFDRTWWGTTRVRHERGLNVNGISPLVEPSLSIGHGGARPETKPFDRTWWGTTRVRQEHDLNVNGIGPLVEPSLSIGHGGARPEVTLRIARWPSEYEGIQTQNEFFTFRGMGCRWPSERGGIQTHGTLRIAHEANTRVLNPVGRRCRREGINLVV
ncbi:hypothetical protein DFH06DRAFT_1143860 [Mycena polygramma]|nr:hypothetical protein DFH06DRAFT_1143860 [Mycena polygramma]